MCRRWRGSSESAPAPTTGHTQVPARAAAERLSLPASPSHADLRLPFPPQGPRRLGGDRRPGSSASGPEPRRCPGGRSTPRPSWLLCCTSVCRCRGSNGGRVGVCPGPEPSRGGATVPRTTHLCQPWLSNVVRLFEGSLEVRVSGAHGEFENNY